MNTLHLASNLPSSQGPYMDYLAKSTSPASSFFFQPVTEAEVRLEILSIPNGKSHGLYSCPNQMLKHAHQYLSEPLALLINTSVFQGAYPAKFNYLKWFPFLKPTTPLMQIIIDQYLCFPILIEFLKS